MKKNNVEEEILKLWETRQIIDRETKFKPAMLLVDKEGTVTPKCGAHRSTRHMEKDNPVASFI
ncbi:unnamed protein product [marine sediment metagenome]|uniref:Uncharacterized protein n=1 Tax=marine sediment metagenome TaxID=412755 RepID=X1IUE9_9ZZZZ